jgi:putative glutamine amidotransferase
VLGICRGLQLWNVALGGKLIQHLPKEAGHTVPTLDQVHWVKPVGGSILESLLGSAPLLVNSRHHQAADPQHLGEGLVVSAWSRDGVVEALEMPRMKFAMAVQWHPEELWRRDRRLFEGYAKAALGEAWPLQR